MAKIENVEIIEKEIGRWSPGDLAFIFKLNYLSETEELDSKIIIDAFFQKKERSQPRWPSNRQPWYSVSLQFSGIKKFRIQDVDNTPKQVMGFDIVDISDRGWEGIDFHIEDYENGVIEFYSKRVCVLSVEKNYKFMI